MRKLIIGAAVITLAAAFFTTACKKPVFVPEEEVIPEDPDEPGVYEEGLYVTEKGAGMFTGEDWNNAMSVENLRTLLFVTGNTEGTSVSSPSCITSDSTFLNCSTLVSWSFSDDTISSTMS